MLFPLPHDRVAPGRIAKTLLLLSSLAALMACSSSKKLTQEQSCKEKFDKLHAKFEKKKYTEVREPFSELITSCPGFPFVEQVMYELAESYFRLGDWVEAESEYGAFLKDFPTSKKYGEEVQYKLALVAAKQVEIPQRDQSKTLDAIAGFETFIDAYPESNRADSAKTQLEKLKDQLVQKKLQIARLYLRMGEPQAAAIYYKSLIKEFGGRVDLRDVNLRLAQCYIALDQFDEAETYLTKFDGIAKDDPFREKVKQAYQDLEKARNKLARQKKEEQELGRRQEPM